MVTPRLLRLCSLRDHDTSATLRRDRRVSLALLSPPDLAVSVRGFAHVAKDKMEIDEQFAVLKVEIGEVKSDMAYRILIDSEIAISARERFRPWYEAAMRELDALG